MRLTSFLACAVLTSVLVCIPAMAANPVLRIVCQGDDVGAEVLVNGKFRGECPVELQVPPGTLKVRVQKKGCEGPERTFEQSVRVAPDSLKTLEIVLVAARPAGAEQDGNKSATAKTLPGDIKITTALREAAGAGDASAMLTMGAYYEAGKGLPKSYEQAFNWYRKAMDAGNADAAYQLGRMYQFGIGVRASMTESEVLFKKAALGGSVRALSDLYLDAQDLVKKAGVSIEQAAPILLKAANAGDVGSMIWLGYYYRAWTNPKDLGESERWRSQAIASLTKLADTGDISSMEALGW